MRSGVRLIPLGLALSLAFSALGQSGVKVEVEDLTDNRVTSEMMRGSLELRLKLSGTGLEKATGARVIVKEAKDDRGTALTKAGEDLPDFSPRDNNSGMLMLNLLPPARAASKVRIKGTVELYVPSRDPSANVTIDKALSKLDTPLSSKVLKAAGIEITPLSAARQKAMLEVDRKLTPEKIAMIRAEGKKAGAPEKEIEMVIGLAQAFEAMDGPARPGTILLSGKESSFDRVFRIEVLGADGKPIDFSERSSSTRGDDTVMTLVPREPPPASASLQLMVLTDKSKMSFPFELSLELP